jgi:hypothetical protein
MRRPNRPPDVKLALEYLIGKFENDKYGKITHKFHKPDSEEEARSRAALLKLLREQDRELDPEIRFFLAELLDPNSQLEERIFTIANRRSGRQRDHALMISIALFIALENYCGRKVESAKEEAKNIYRVSMSTIDRAWSNHKDASIAMAESMRPRWKPRTIN